MILLPSGAIVNYIAAKETFRPLAYQDGGGVWTIGYGYTWNVAAGTVWTRDYGVLMLGQVVHIVNRQIERVVKHVLNQNQSDSLTSFVYNVGIGTFMKSDTGKYLDSLLMGSEDTNKLEAAAHAMLGYIHDRAGKVEPGLVVRRTEEFSIWHGVPVHEYK